ncbi:hypothetical protein N9917_01080 [Deltaproteobacteria bacterium]|nr:hypothetical protein [Deltaproteobacteria bacterium]
MSQQVPDFWDILLNQKTGSTNIEMGPNGEDFTHRYLTAGYEPENAVETRMKGKELGKGQFSSVQTLSDSHRSKSAVTLPIEAGTRVQFASNVGAVLTYDNPPAPNDYGTVVTVKSATHGTITAHDGRVFVEWGDGDVRAIHAMHLRYAKGGSQRRSQQLPNRFRVASLGDLSGFFSGALVSSDKSGELVHKATKDLWGFRQEGDAYVVERLFADSGEPLKG